MMHIHYLPLHTNAYIYPSLVQENISLKPRQTKEGKVLFLRQKNLTGVGA